MEVPGKAGRALARPEKCHVRKGVEIYFLHLNHTFRDSYGLCHRTSAAGMLKVFDSYS